MRRTDGKKFESDHCCSQTMWSDRGRYSTCQWLLIMKMSQCCSTTLSGWRCILRQNSEFGLSFQKPLDFLVCTDVLQCIDGLESIKNFLVLSGLICWCQLQCSHVGSGLNEGLGCLSVSGVCVFLLSLICKVVLCQFSVSLASCATQWPASKHSREDSPMAEVCCGGDGTPWELVGWLSNWLSATRGWNHCSWVHTLCLTVLQQKQSSLH